MRKLRYNNYRMYIYKDYDVLYRGDKIHRMDYEKIMLGFNPYQMKSLLIGIEFDLHTVRLRLEKGKEIVLEFLDYEKEFVVEARNDEAFIKYISERIKGFRYQKEVREFFLRNSSLP